MSDFTTSRGHRLAAHKELDQDFAAYHAERVHPDAYVYKDRPIRTVAIEARELVESRGYDTHPNGRGLFYGPGCPENSARRCSGCLRLFGLLVAATRSMNAAHYTTLRNYFMSPEFG